MKLLKISLNNFLGAKNQSYSFPNGCNAIFYGKNGTGKTTVYSAYTWLLFGKVEDTTNFSPKTIVGEKEAHNLNHEVEAIFQTDSSRIVSFKKIFKEVYKKKRGSLSAEFSGHNTEYYVDGVPVKEREYIASVEKYCGDIDKLKLLTMPKYFAEALKWEERRKLLLEVCGDIDDDDVIRSNDELKEIYKYLLIDGTTDQFMGVEEYKKVASKKETDINKKLDIIPARIDEAEKAIPDIQQLNKEEIEKSISVLESENNKLLEKRAAVNATSNTELRKHIAELQAKLAEKKAEYIQGINAENEAVNTSIIVERTNLNVASNNLVELECEIKKKESLKSELEGKREQLLEQYKNEYALVFDESEAVCKYCGQALPADKVSKMKEDFNLRKSNALNKIANDGKECSKEVIAKIESEIDNLKAEAEKYKAKKEASETAIKNLSSKKIAQDFESTEEYKTLSAEISKANSAAANNDYSVSEAIRNIDEKINVINYDIKSKQNKLADLKTAHVQRERISELEKEETELAAEYERLEKGIYLCNLFTRLKVQLLNDRINSKFKTIKFRLFTEQINGGLKEGCEILVKSEAGAMVPYSASNSTVNDGAKPIAGLEVIEVLSKHWGIKMPVFIDNAESITEPFETDTQVIQLYAKKGENSLRLNISDMGVA